MGPPKRTFLTTLILLTMTCWHGTAAQSGPALSPPGEIRADTVYGRIGDWFAVRDLEGGTTPHAAFAGRVLFVNFWATWCPPCVEELPAIEALMEALHDEDVAFLLISIDDDERDVHRFIRRYDLSKPVYFRGWQSGESTFTAGIVPATFIVSREGEITYQHHGAADWNRAPVRSFLRELARR